MQLHLNSLGREFCLDCDVLYTCSMESAESFLMPRQRAEVIWLFRVENRTTIS